MNSSSQRDFQKEVLEYVRRPGYQPVKPRVIAKKLKLTEHELDELKRAIKRLVKAGQLTYGANHFVKAASAVPQASSGLKTNRITGTFRRAAAGFGFVRPRATPTAKDTDIYINAGDTGDASTGDVVLVRLTKQLSKLGNPRGEIVEIIERETNQFVGTYFERGDQGFVRVDGKTFSLPIAVGDPGAKNAQPDDKVVFEMIRFPSQTHGGEGVITEVLGSRGEPGVDTLSIIREYNLPMEFPEDVLESARQQVLEFDESQLDGRTDLTAETVITIDPVTARDFDDAISLERTPEGHWRLGVHIADVAHFVPVGTPLDREAYNRATSTYLPDRVLPMLPELISNGLASLQPDRVRLTKTAYLEFDDAGNRLSTELVSGAIKSCRRFTYEEVDSYLADRQAWQAKLTPQVHGLLGRMHELAMVLRGRRMKRGALELSLDAVEIDLDKQGRVIGAHRELNTESHQMIEEFMLAANEAVATQLAELEWPFLRRVHNAPDPRKLKVLTEFVRELGLEVNSLESRFELQDLLTRVIDLPEKHAVHYSVLRAMQRAVYSPEEEGHFALASDCYCHFTSPIRRYPDLTIHRLIDAYLTGKKPKNDFAQLVIMGQHCSDRERRAEAAERELTKVKLLNYLASQIGLELEAIVTGVEEFGLFVQGRELPAEGLIHVTALQDDYYHFEPNSHSLVGRRAGNAYRLGDLVRVVVARVDVDRRELDFRLVEKEPRTARVPRPASSRRGRSGERVAQTANRKTAKGQPGKTRTGNLAKPRKARRKKRG